MSKSKSQNNKSIWQLVGLIAVFVILIVAFVSYKFGYQAAKQYAIRRYEEIKTETKPLYNCPVTNRQTGEEINLISESPEDCQKFYGWLNMPVRYQTPPSSLFPEPPRSGREIWEDIEEQQFRQKAIQFFDKFLYGF